MPLGALGGAGIGEGVGGAIGGIAVLAGAGGEGGERYYKKAIAAMEKLKTSNFDYRALSAPELRLVAEYFPEEYEAVVPESVRLAEESAVGRGAQLDALGYFSGVRDKGLPIETRLATEEAQRGIANERRLGQEAILENLQARGRLGGGTEIAARLGTDQQAMELARGMGSDLARSEIEARMGAAGAAGGIGSQIRGGDVGLSQWNADATNRFNQWVAEQQTQAAAESAGARERAGFANVENRQRIGEENVMNQYNTALQNLTRQNALKGGAFQQELQKAQGLQGAYWQAAYQKDRQKRAREEAIVGVGKGLGGAAGGAAGGIFG